MGPPLILVRHGETDWNAAKRLQGQTDIPLNARGRDQAEAVGRSLSRDVPQLAEYAFVASPLVRAQETMRRMRQAMGLAPDSYDLDERLKEMSFGTWEGSTLAEIRARDPATMKARDADRWTHRPPRGESYVDLTDRVRRALERRPRPLLVVAHGGVARAMLTLFGGVANDAAPGIVIRQGRALAFHDGAWRWI
jgi:probable phosphoglycerate mutase